MQSSVANVDLYLAERNHTLPSRVKSPWTTDYCPEIDVTPELCPKEASYFQSLIGVLRWIVELGRGDLTIEVYALTSMMTLPCEGHLQQIFNMFAILKTNHNGVMVFDPTEPEIDESCFTQEYWSASAYRECEE